MSSFEAREDQLFKDEVAKVNEWWKVSSSFLSKACALYLP